MNNRAPGRLVAKFPNAVAKNRPQLREDEILLASIETGATGVIQISNQPLHTRPISLDRLKLGKGAGKVGRLEAKQERHDSRLKGAGQGACLEKDPWRLNILGGQTNDAEM